jgi:hypothetical protein
LDRPRIQDLEAVIKTMEATEMVMGS